MRFSMETLTRTFALLMFTVLIIAKKTKDLEIIVEHKPESCYEQAKQGDEVQVHYTGTLETGEIFDTSRQQGRTPLQFVLGNKMVIPGWEQGIEGMCVGEKRKLIIPPHLAYGKNGIPPRIPGDATLIFETELVAIGGRNTEDMLWNFLRFLSTPAAVCLVIYYVYDKYKKSENESQKSKKQTKEEKRNKKKRN